MLNYVRLLWLLLFVVFASVETHGASSIPVPPEVESPIGYLNVVRETSLPPVADRLFIQPKVELFILLNEKDAYLLVYTGEKFSTVCRVPKYAKYTVLMIRDKTGRNVSFRGALEVDSVPVILHKGEELPIKEKVKGGYVALVRCDDRTLPFFVSDSLKGIVFEKKSAFAKFAEVQKEKGLRCVEGIWMPLDKAAVVLKNKRRVDAENARIWKGVVRGAENGVVVLKNDKILHGKLVGKVLSHFFFLAGGKYYWIGIEDVKPIPYEKIITLGRIDRAERLLDKSDKLIESDMGMALKHIQDALRLVAEIPKSDSIERKQSEKITRTALKMTKRIEKKLHDEYKVIYDYTVFPDYVVDYHLKMGHILFKRKFWIKSEQLCAKCHATGRITCPTCHGKGEIAVKCPTCGGSGRVKCPICNGTGWRTCDICGGKGYIYKKRRGGGFYASFGRECYYPRYWRPGKLVSMGNFIMAVGPTPVFGGPCFSGMSIGNGGGGGDAVKVVCWKCGGRGTLRCPKTRKCGKCGGTGVLMEICPECEGRKNITCPKCHGRGFTGEIQTLPKPSPPSGMLP